MAIGFTLRQLEYLVAVGETGSVTLAAENLGVSPPTVSAAISQLEAELGVQLFTRKHAHGLSPTSGGRRVLTDTIKLLASAENLRSLASDIAETVSGPLSIGCFTTIAPMILPDLRLQFETQFPNVKIRQMEGNHARILGALHEGQIDIGLTYDLDIPGSVCFEPLLERPAYVMVAPSHALAGHVSLTPEQLAPEPLILLDLPYSADYFLSVFKKAGLKPNIVERVRDIELMRGMVANGFGYALANIRYRAKTAPDGKAVKSIPLESSLRPMKLGLVTRKGEHRPRVVRAFEDHCREVIEDKRLSGLYPT